MNVCTLDNNEAGNEDCGVCYIGRHSSVFQEIQELDHRAVAGQVCERIIGMKKKRRSNAMTRQT